MSECLSCKIVAEAKGSVGYSAVYYRHHEVLGLEVTGE